MLNLWLEIRWDWRHENSEPEENEINFNTQLDMIISNYFILIGLTIPEWHDLTGW